MQRGPENKMNVLIIGGAMAASLGAVALMHETGNDSHEDRVRAAVVSLPTPIAELNLADEDPRPPHPTYVAPTPTHIPRTRPHIASRSRLQPVAKFHYDSHAKYLPLTDEEWNIIVTCESDHHRYEVYEGHYSYFQFDLQTWHGAGGTGNPMDHSYDEQFAIAQKVEAARGEEPWTCAEERHNHVRNIHAERNPDYLSAR